MLYLLKHNADPNYSNNQGQTVLATVEKVNRKFIMVRENGKAFGSWRVPANMLEAA